MRKTMPAIFLGHSNAWAVLPCRFSKSTYQYDLTGGNVEPLEPMF
jgi:hypothetical protein